MLALDSDTIKNYLIEQNLPGEVQEETNQSYFIHKTSLGEFPIFFRIYENREQLQILTFFPLKIPRDRLDTMARFLHHINKEIDIPGFGMDEKMGLCFHRLMIPAFDSQVPKALIDIYLKSIPLLCDHFTGPIKKAIHSALNFDEIIKKTGQAK